MSGQNQSQDNNSKELSDALKEARENLDKLLEQEEQTISKTEQEEVKPND